MLEDEALEAGMLDSDELDDDELDFFLSLSLLSHPVNKTTLRQDAMSNVFFSKDVALMEYIKLSLYVV